MKRTFYLVIVTLFYAFSFYSLSNASDVLKDTNVSPELQVKADLITSSVMKKVEDKANGNPQKLNNLLNDLMQNPENIKKYLDSDQKKDWEEISKILGNKIKL